MTVFPLLALTLLLSIAGAARTRNSISASTSDCEAKGCSHECETVGEFPLCVCPPDMILESDGKTCKETTSFLLAMFRGIKLYNEESQEESTVAPVKVRCLDFHYGRHELYAYTNNSIMRYPLSKGKKASPVSMVTRTDTSVTSLAVDWVHDVIYYISEQQSVLGVTSLDGEDKRIVLSHNGSLPAEWHDLTVDPYVKKLFWVGSKSVFSSNLEGEDFATNLISWIHPDKIAVDVSNQIIYIIGWQKGSAHKYIARASYNGTKVGEDIELPQPAASLIYGFGVLGNTAYWESNHGGENLYKCDMKTVENNNKAVVTLVAEVNQIVYDMKLFHKDVQKSQN